MAIEFHCSHCGKQVRAPDEAGGKHGRCPACEQSVYIPMPDDQLEPLDIAPLSDDDAAEQERLTRESRELEQQLMRESDKPPPETSTPSPGASVPEPTPDMELLCIEYARAMAKGDLSRAEAMANDIRSHPALANEVIQRLVADEIPPDALADIPHPVLVGFFKQLRGK